MKNIKKIAVIQEKEQFAHQCLDDGNERHIDNVWDYITSARITTFVIQLISVIFETYLVYNHYGKSRGYDSNNMTQGQQLETIFVTLLIVPIIFTSLEWLSRSLYERASKKWLVTTQLQLKGDTYIIAKNGVISYRDYTWFFVIRSFMTLSAVSGVFFLVKDNSPKAVLSDVTVAVSPISKQIDAVGVSISNANKVITELQTAIKRIESNPSNYAEWEGKVYLLPEMRVAIQQNNQNIQTQQRLIEKHLSEKSKLQARLEDKEKKTEERNNSSKIQAEATSYTYGSSVGIIWLFFEGVFYLCLRYIARQSLKIRINEMNIGLENVNTTTLLVREEDKTRRNRASKRFVGKKEGRNPIGFGKHESPSTHTVTVKLEKEGFVNTCPYCHVQHKVTNKRQKYCSDAHRQAFNRLSKPEKERSWEKAGYRLEDLVSRK